MQTKVVQENNEANYQYNNCICTKTPNVKVTIIGCGNDIQVGELNKDTDIEILCEGNNNKIIIEGKSNFVGIKLKIFIRQNNNYLKMEQFCKAITYGYRKESPIEIVMMGDSILLIEKGTTFAPSTNIYMHPFSYVNIKQDCMFSFDSVVQAGDGHSIFDIQVQENTNSSLSKLQDKEWLNKIVIGAHTWVGRNAIILGGNTELAQGSIVAAQSFVKGIYPNNILIAGTPAKIKKKNISWCRSNMEDNIKRCCSPYAIPTISMDTLSERKKKLCKIDIFHEYFTTLNALDEYICVVSAKDTPGHKFTEKEKRTMQKCGLNADLIGMHWCGYIGVFDEKKVFFEKTSEINQSLFEELVIGSEQVYVRSSPLKDGNISEVVINANDYSVNERGLNIVIWDKCTHQLIDTVCFDTHMLGIPCIRKTNFC